MSLKISPAATAHMGRKPLPRAASMAAGVAAGSRTVRGATPTTAGPSLLSEVAETQSRAYRETLSLLGGAKFWRAVTSKSEVHSAIVRGIPFGSLMYLAKNVTWLEEVDFVKVLGISARTLRRQSETLEKSMPADLASKTWLFAETLARATDIFGGKEEAERWMSKPAMGLDGQRPIDMLQTVQGAELVNDFLGRLEYGVYT